MIGLRDLVFFVSGCIHGHSRVFSLLYILQSWTFRKGSRICHVWFSVLRLSNQMMLGISHRLQHDISSWLLGTSQSLSVLACGFFVVWNCKWPHMNEEVMRCIGAICRHMSKRLVTVRSKSSSSRTRPKEGQPWAVGVMEGRQKRRHTVEESQRWIITYKEMQSNV